MKRETTKNVAEETLSPATAPAVETPTIIQPNGGAAIIAAKIDVTKFRVDQDYGAHIQTRKKALHVPVGAPNEKTWIWPHPHEYDDDGHDKWWWQVPILDDKANRRTYLVTPELYPELMGDVRLKMLVPYMTRQGTPGLWMFKLPEETTGRIDTWNETARYAAEEYAGKWFRLLREADCYSGLECSVVLPTPKFPEEGMQHLVNLAFRGRIITDLNHPILKDLREGS